MKILPILTGLTNKNTNFGNKNVSQNIMDRDITYPVKNPKRYTFEFTDFPLEEDATNLPSNRFLHSDTFRVKELFDPIADIQRSFRYLQYSDNDVMLGSDLWYGFSKQLQNFDNLSKETSTKDNDFMFKETVHSPWINRQNIKDRSEYNKYLDEKREKINKITGERRTAGLIFEDCTILKHGKLQVDRNLCNFAINILDNTKEKIWGTIERKIIKELKIPLLGNTYGGVYYKKYDIAQKTLSLSKTNTEILANIKKINPVDIYGLRAIL